LTLVNLNPVTVLWWSSLLTFPTLLFPAVSALRFGRRYPELLEMMPWRRLLKPLAVAWTLIIVSLYGLVVVAGLLPSVAETTLWQYTMSSGLGVTCLVILLGIIIYVAVRAINAKRGIDMHLIFKSIPPE
jgi:hypothetical protein